MYIAIFGDLHGKVLLPFLLAKRWQENTGKQLSHLLSVGDLGVYRNFWAMEKTSQRFAKKHPEELGFSKFFFYFDGAPQTIQRSDVVDEALDGIDVNLYFVPGNHEEHAYIQEVRSQYATAANEPVPVDTDWSGNSDQTDFTGYRRIHVLPEGPLVHLDGPLDETTWMPQYEIPLRAINGLDPCTPKHAWSPGKTAPPAMLLSHTTYQGRLDHLPSREPLGSPRLGALIRKLGPSYHFFGHFHTPCPEVELFNDRGGTTRSVGLNQVAFNGEMLEPGCFGILEVNGPEELRFEIVDDDVVWGVRRSEWGRFL